MEISYILRLPERCYNRDVFPKKQIYLHHTVGGSAVSTFNYWKSQTNRVATAYIIERDGTVYEVFDPHYWAWHLGLKTANNTIANKQSIGIELASEGALRDGDELNNICELIGIEKRFDFNYLYAFDIDFNKANPRESFKNAKKLYNKELDRDKYVEVDFRGYRWFDKYSDQQVSSANLLVSHLCNEFKIPMKLIPHTNKFTWDINLVNFSGILTHCNVRLDKTDLHPGWDWTETENVLRKKVNL